MECDYLIVGAGITGLAFADTLLRDSNASVIIVDQNEQPGGAWNQAYPHARLRSDPSGFGLKSFPIRKHIEARDGSMPSRPIQKRDVLDYAQIAVQASLLRTGRVRYLPRTEHVGGGRIKLSDGLTTETVRVVEKIVDATRASRWSKTAHIPCVSYEKSIAIVRPYEVPRTVNRNRLQYDQFCIMGAGIAAMDTALFLLSLGLPPSKISWVKPREPWLISPKLAGLLTDYNLMDCVSTADDADELYNNLDRANYVRRISTDWRPTMHHGAMILDAETAQLRQITNIIRKGHVHGISPIGIMMDDEAQAMPPNTLYIDCTAGPMLRRTPKPIFYENEIILQPVCISDLSLSASIIAGIELQHSEIETKNALCAPLLRSDTPIDFLEVLQTSLANQTRWYADPGLCDWLTHHYLSSVNTSGAPLIEASRHLFQLLGAYSAE